MVKMADSYTAAGITAANEASDEIIRDLTGKYRLACATIAERDATIRTLEARVAALTADIGKLTGRTGTKPRGETFTGSGDRCGA